MTPLELYSREDWHGFSNWKTMLENYLECYHCAVAHPSFSAAIDVRQESYRLIVSWLECWPRSVWKWCALRR